MYFPKLLQNLLWVCFTCILLFNEIGNDPCCLQIKGVFILHFFLVF